MGENHKDRVLIIGAGAMGIVTGYILHLAGAEVTFLIRPHRAEALSRPQTLYSYNDHQLKTFKEYTYLTEPSKIIGGGYDYIIPTLDAVALKNEVGVELVKVIGKAVRGTKTKVIIGTVYFELRPWFLETSGLDGEQVTNGILYIHIYSTKAVTLPLHPPTDESLLAKADFAYADSLGPGFVVDDSSLAVANSFTELYNASGVSYCTVKPAIEFALFASPLFPIFLASELLGWPRYQDIDVNSEPWKLAVAAGKEIQQLSVFGKAGQLAAEATTEAGLAAGMAGMEKAMFPMDLQSFNRYHHGGKVNPQDRQLLHDCLSFGEAEGKDMPALKKLLGLVEN